MGKEELISKVIDKLDKLERIPEIFMKAGLAYAGYRATNHWTGAITALVSLKLATGNNLAGGAAGVAGLTLIGLSNAFGDIKSKEDLEAFANTGLPASGLWGVPSWWGTPGT